MSHSNKFRCIFIATCLYLSLSSVAPAELITNGDFELGDYSGWTAYNQTGDGMAFVTMDAFAPSSGFATVGPSGGTYYAIFDQNFPGDSIALIQNFTVPMGVTNVLLKFDLFVNDWFTSSEATDGLDFIPADFSSGDPIPELQHARVDILTSASLPFSTSLADVKANLYTGRDGDPFANLDGLGNPIGNPYTVNAFDLTGVLTPGETYQFRFASVNNAAPLNVGFDNVSIETSGSSAVPEPSMIACLSLFLCGVGIRRISQVKRVV